MKSTQEKRIFELEMRIAEQDQTLQTMSDEVFQHQKKLDQLESTCNLLREKISSYIEESGPDKQNDEKPPHY